MEEMTPTEALGRLIYRFFRTYKPSYQFRKEEADRITADMAEDIEVDKWTSREIHEAGIMVRRTFNGHWPKPVHLLDALKEVRKLNKPPEAFNPELAARKRIERERQRGGAVGEIKPPEHYMQDIKKMMEE